MSIVDIIAVIIVAFLNILLGWFWYSPKFLGARWAKEHNFQVGELEATPWHIVGAYIVSFITALFFSLLVNWLNINSVSGGILLGLCLWAGFIATTHFSGVLWAKKPIVAYFIDSGFQLASMIMMGLILGVW